MSTFCTGLKSHDVTSSLNSRVETDLGTNSFALLTFDPLSAKPSSQEHPPPHTTLAGNHGDGPGRQDDDSDSSNWSSSEDEGEGEGAREEHGLVTEMRPSTHSTLIAEWEWRAMNQNTTRYTINFNVLQYSKGLVYVPQGKILLTDTKFYYSFGHISFYSLKY